MLGFNVTLGWPAQPGCTPVVAGVLCCIWGCPWIEQVSSQATAHAQQKLRLLSAASCRLYQCCCFVIGDGTSHAATSHAATPFLLHDIMLAFLASPMPGLSRDPDRDNSMQTKTCHNAMTVCMTIIYQASWTGIAAAGALNNTQPGDQQHALGCAAPQAWMRTARNKTNF